MSNDFLGLKGFAASVKRKIGPRIQEPGTATITMDEIRKAGVSIPKGDKRLKEGITLDNLAPSDRAKIEKIRQDEFGPES